MKAMDWGSDIKGFLAWKAAHPWAEEQKQMGRNYKARDNMNLGIDRTLVRGAYRTVIPAYEDGPGRDPGLFGGWTIP